MAFRHPSSYTDLNKHKHHCCVQVNLGYVEAGVQKNALVKLRVCPEHALQLNYKKDAAVLKVCQHSQALGQANCAPVPAAGLTQRCADAAGSGKTKTKRAAAR